MGFFNPALLWFALGGAIPVIIHLLHRQKYRRIRWAAMEFLLAALKKTQRRMRIENLLLLLLRILIMIVLAMALARPFFREAPVEFMEQSDTHHIFVIDNSYSMGYKKAQESLLDVAKKTAQKKLEELRKLTEEDKITVLLMSNYPEVYVPESNKRDRVRDRIGEIRLSHFGTSVYTTFQKIKEVVDKSRNQQKKIYLFTDFQRNAWEPADETEAKRFAELLKGLTSKETVKVYLVDVGDDAADNRAIVDLRVESPVVTVKSSTRFSVDLHNWSAVSYRAVAVNLFVDDALFKTENVPLAANSSMTVSFKYDFVEPGAHHVKVTTEPDFLNVDDERTLALDVKDGLVGVLVDGEPGNRRFASETDYLKIVLDSTNLFKIDRQVTPEMFETNALAKYDFIVLANVQSLTPEKVEQVEKFVKNGGGLLVALGAKVDRLWYNEHLWKEGKGLLPAQLGEIGGTPPDQDPRVPVRIQNYKTSHPIFRTFRKGLAKQPRDLIFYQFFKMEKFDAESVVADFDDGMSTPAWLEKTYGDGRVLVFNNTVDDGWNLQVPGRIPYVVMMINAAEHVGARPQGRRNLFIGDFISIQMTGDKYDMFGLDTPGEGQISISPEAPKEGQTFWVRYPAPPPDRKPGEAKPTENEGLRFAGKYTLKAAKAKPEDRPEAYFAVNLPPRTPSPEELHRCEGNLDRIKDDEIKKRLPDFKFELIGRKGSDQTEVDLAPPASGLWKYLVYALVLLMAAESMLAWLFGKAKQ